MLLQFMSKGDSVMSANIQTYLKSTYGYTDFQIAQIRYALLSILSEMSKLIIIGIFFYCTGNVTAYLLAAAVLCTLRTATGGLHYKHYWSCLIMSFLFFYAGICVLPVLTIPNYVQLLLLCLCILLNYKYAPVVSSFRPVPDGILIRKAKLQSFLIISIYACLVFLIPNNRHMPVGTWIILLQSLQLTAANLLQKRRKNHETPE